MRITSVLIGCTLAANAQQAANLKDLQPTVVGSVPTVSITEYAVPTTGSEPRGIAAGPDGAIWFTEQGGNKIGRVTTAGVITEFPTAASPYGIVAGPDGALWFTEYVGNKIGRITTTGVVTEFPVPTFGSQPYGIAAGPDGALWFTENTGKIGRVTTAGVITEFPVPTPDNNPDGITAGPDGALWFIGAFGGQIGRVTTAGVITEFPAPTPPISPAGSDSAITVGSDGALWFTVATWDKIGRITTAGVLTEFPLPTAVSEPLGITSGPDGALWFTEGAGKIGRITTAGDITEFPLPTASEPLGITTGPDGALWFAEWSEGKIGRLTGMFAVGSFGQIVSGGTWAMTLDAVNLGNTPAQVRINFSDNNGNPLVMPLTFPQLPPAEGTELVSTLDRTLNPNAQLLMESTGPDNAATLIGTGQLLNSGIVSGFGIFSNPTQHWNAMVPLETRNASKYILTFDNTTPLTTGVAVANLAAQAVNVPVIIRDDTGAQIGNPTIALSALGHTSFMLDNPRLGFPVTSSERGTIEFDTPPGGQISVLGLRANGPALTTLPVLANVDTRGGSIAHVAYHGGWTSTFYLVNTGDVPAQFTLSFFDENGNALPVLLQLPQAEISITTSAFTQTLAGGAMLVVNTQAPDELPVVVGSAQLTTTGNINGFEIFRWTTFGQEASIPLETRTPSSFVLVFDDTNGLTTGVALANVSGTSGDITATFRDDAGTRIGSPATISLAAHGHTSFMLPDHYPAAAGKRGMVEFAAPQGVGISVIGLRAKSDGTLTTIPVLTK